MGVIFLATVTYSWIVFDGDVSHQRLASKGFNEAPTSFSFLQLAAPILLLVLTRLRMPVSTSVLLLSAFSTQANSIGKVLSKSFTGYILAFFVAIIVWLLVQKFVSKYFQKKKPAKFWTPLQWITSGALWSIWISQDAANIAVYLPRSLDIYQFIAFSGFIFLGLGVLFYLKGDKIQGIVNEKSGVTDVRAATVVDLVYACLLYYFKVVSTIPISTTWVFIGLLGGRELAVAITKKRLKKRKKSLKKASRMLGRDLLYASIGLILSLLLAFAINSDLREEIIDTVSTEVSE
jgi:phosphate/sulfate permease